MFGLSAAGIPESLATRGSIVCSLTKSELYYKKTKEYAGIGSSMRFHFALMIDYLGI